LPTIIFLFLLIIIQNFQTLVLQYDIKM